MALTELMCRQAKAEEKTYTMSDGRGLMLEIRPNGSKLWIVRYWVGGKEKRTSLGKFPDIGVREARDKNIDLRRSLASGAPIGANSETFADVAAEWLEKRMIPKCAESYLRTLRLRLERLIFPAVGHMKIHDITPAAVLQLCRRLEAKGTLETASIVKQIIGQVFNYAIATTRCETNPTLALRGALQTRKEKHYAALTKPDKIALFMRQIEGYPYKLIRCAMKFSALTFCRPGEIRHAEWDEVDFEEAEWRIPPEKMKMKRLHIVPLARQTADILTELKAMTGHQKWIFPSARNDGKCMSENAIRVALRSMGYGNEDMTAHGFRAMASTILNDSQRFAPDLVEWQLSHVDKDAVRGAYNRAEYLRQRREMMQWWADWLDGLKEGEASVKRAVETPGQGIR